MFLVRLSLKGPSKRQNLLGNFLKNHMKKAIALAAVAAFALSATPALAWNFGGSDITVTNSSSAYVSNDVNTSASTGGNDANGGYKGGNGGWIMTGGALSTSIVGNDVNNNYVSVKTNCGCKGDISVSNNSYKAVVKNDVDTSAKTGYNDANGGAGSSGWLWWGGSNGGNGGAIVTGNAVAGAQVGTFANTNVVRIRR